MTFKSINQNPTFVHLSSSKKSLERTCLLIGINRHKMMDGKSDEKTPVVKVKPAASKRKRRHKPKDFPKRPLSAYNIFFKDTREQILASKEAEGGKGSFVDFQSMAKEIASRWKNRVPAEERERVDSLAKKDMERYREEVKAYEEKMVRRSRMEREESASLRQQAASTQLAPAPSADLASSLRTVSSTRSSGGLDVCAAERAGDRTLPAGSGDAILRSYLGAVNQQVFQQQQLLEELRAVEARSMQVRRRLQHADGLSSSFQSQQIGLLPSLLGGDMMLHQQFGAYLPPAIVLGGSSVNPSLLPWPDYTHRLTGQNIFGLLGPRAP
jgi:hypothetical protein